MIKYFKESWKLSPMSIIGLISFPVVAILISLLSWLGSGKIEEGLVSLWWMSLPTVILMGDCAGTIRFKKAVIHKQLNNQ